MAQNVTIAGASYTDVPAIEVPKTGGGTAVFSDPSDVTATQADVLVGVDFLDSGGVLRSGSLVVTDIITVTFSSFNSLPKTVNNAAITSDHVLLRSELGTPASQTGDWTVTTASGVLTVSGSISGSTSLTLVLGKNITSISGGGT